MRALGTDPVVGDELCRQSVQHHGAAGTHPVLAGGIRKPRNTSSSVLGAQISRRRPQPQTAAMTANFSSTEGGQGGMASRPRKKRLSLGFMPVNPQSSILNRRPKKPLNPHQPLCKGRATGRQVRMPAAGLHVLLHVEVIYIVVSVVVLCLV